MKYRSDYQETHDIDWFFRYKGKPYHAASNGGVLPDVIDSTLNRTIQEKLEGVAGSFEVVLAEDLQNYYGKDADLDSFEEYASKGFISLDRTEGINDRFPHYHLVAYPKNGKAFNDQNLLKLMPELKDADIAII